MDRNSFKSLMSIFVAETDFDKKVEILFAANLASLTKPQIQKLLDTLDEPDTGKLIKAISKKIDE